MSPKIKHKLQEIKCQAEQELFAPQTDVSSRYDAMGRAVACNLMLDGMTPETVIETINNPFFAGTADRPAIIRTAEFFNGLI